jgi:PKD repeat protein
MIFKTTTLKNALFIFLILFGISTITAQTNLPYFTNFESNDGGWTDGGNDSRRRESDNSPQGDFSWELKDDSGDASSFYQEFNLSGYTTVTISFSFQSRSFDDDDDIFWVKLDGTEVLEYSHDVDWGNNNRTYDVSITLNATNYTFNSDSEIRFETDAGNSDRIYFDKINIQGTSLEPVAEFSVDNVTPYIDDVIAFTDASNYTPTTWAWSFSNPGNVTYVNGTSASSQNPEVRFNAAGNYTVTLTVTNTAGSDTETKTNYITVIAPASDNPASFTASTSTTNPYTFLDLSATANSDGDNILVAYNTTNSFGTPTTDANNNIVLSGNGTIIYEGNATAVNTNTLPQLRQNRTYYFKAWSIGSAGFSRGVEANATTLAVEAPISFTATSSTFNNNVTFSAQANSLNDNLMLVYNTEDDFGIPEDGILYQIGDDIGNDIVLLSSVDAATINNYVHDLLQLDTRYYYRIYSVSNGIWYYSQSYREDDDRTIDGFIWQNEISTDDTQDDMPYTRGQEVYPNITVSGVSLGSGLRIREDDDKITVDRISTSGTLNTGDNDYFEFTLTPDSGYEINFQEFFYNGDDSGGNVNKGALRSSIDNFASNIEGDVKPDTGVEFDLTSADFQGVDGAITFRIYLWDASSDNADFELEDFGFKGTISEYAIWDGTSWSNTTGPNLATRAVIDGDYNTSIGGTQTSFRCKSLTINAGKTLTVDDATFVEVNYNTLGAGNIVIETKGAFVQRNDGTFNVTGTSTVNKSTPNKDQWYHYTYWSSPVKNMDVNIAFPNIKRRYYWDGSRWMYMGGGTMVPTRGYTITGKTSGVQTVSFTGEFNTGTITAPIYYNASNGENWNLIGNPYPSAIDLNQFLGTNTSVLEGAAYFWSQETPPVGGEFSGTDYIPFNATGSVSSSPDSARAVNGFVPSGQSFFIASKAAGNATFTNAMRMADATSNSQFFKSAGVPPKGLVKSNKLWLNLTSDNGVFSQILVGYVEGATNDDDGLQYDATKFGEGSGSYLYSTIENSNKKFVLQGKDSNSINLDEVIGLGFKASIENTFSISIANLKGDFLQGNTIYLKDKLLNTIHNLSASSYVFSSEAGEFNNRFEIVFKNQTLSTRDLEISNTNIEVIVLNTGYVQFSTNDNSVIKNIKIYNALGQRIFDIKTNSTIKTYNFTNQKASIYFAKVTLANEKELTKKFVVR